METKKNNIIPIFKTQGSICRSLLTVEDELKINDDSPVSIFAIAKKYNLDKLVIIDNSFLEFPRLYKTCNKYNIQLIYGLSFVICNNSIEKTEESLLSNCKVSVIMKNSAGYKDLIKLNNRINANKETFYYESRGDYKDIQELITENLLLTIPPFDNFIHKNLLENGNCLPSFGKLNPIMTHSNMGLPWNDLLNDAILKYAKNNNYELQEVHPIYYLNRTDFKTYTCLRAIDNRSKFNSPNINFLTSPEFCWESYQEKIK